MNTKQYTLFLYTIDFPYGETEPYLKNELPYLCQNFSKVVIVSEKREKREVELPSNVEVYFISELHTGSTKKALLLKNGLRLFGILAKEFSLVENKRFFLSRWKLTVSELIQALIVSEKIRSLLVKHKGPVIHYSFWMNAFPLALSLLCKKKVIDTFVFRVHGFDLYKERWPSGFIPYRETNYRYAKAVFPVSEMGVRYIRSHFSHSEKAQCSYLGTADHGKNPFDSAGFTIVTCSSVIPLKRLDLLADALRYIPFPLSWYHFGTGSKEYQLFIEKQTSALPAHITMHWMGQVSQQQLFDFYIKNPVSVFMNVSETEGLPVSIMEAISFGIPVIATDVGGTSEIVKAETGVLVRKQVEPVELAKAIEHFRNGIFMQQPVRDKVKTFWRDHFSASHNYQAFCDTLKQIAEKPGI